MKRNAAYGIAIAVVVGVTGLNVVQAQTESSTPSGQSLGEYARQVRKGPDTKSKPKVFDNDNLPKNDNLSVVGNAASPVEPGAEEKPAEPANAAGAANDGKTQAANPPSDTSKMEPKEREAAWKQWGDRLADQQKQIDLSQRELDVLQREYQVRAAAMYGDVGAKQKLEDLQEQARKAGVPSSVRE